ncbi:MAG TPA: DUF2505 family protein [Acidimicrobiales bacterium]|jgi:hypothetical protein|nr:DUF2505 family protein [Acidimicrobiales bacterium]
MRFHAEHRFPGPVGAVAALLLDPGFHRQLELPDLRLLEVVDGGTDTNESHLRLRYDFVGHLDPLASRLLAGRRLTWIQELRLDRSSGVGRLSFEAEAAPDRLHGVADMVLEPVDDVTVRRLDGELVVAVPLMGRRAEGRIVPGLLRRLDIEAAALAERLRAT